AWRTSILLNLGLVYRRTGYLLKAMEAFEQAWRLSKYEEDWKVRALADLAAGELAQLNARLGREKPLRTFLKELEGRTLVGPGAQKLASAHDALWFMRFKPNEAFGCGAIAVDRLRQAIDPSPKLMTSALSRSHNSQRGMSLAEVATLADQFGIH